MARNFDSDGGGEQPGVHEVPRGTGHDAELAGSGHGVRELPAGHRDAHAALDDDGEFVPVDLHVASLPTCR